MPTEQFIRSHILALNLFSFYINFLLTSINRYGTLVSDKDMLLIERSKAMKYYFMTKSSSKCGCSNTTWRVTEDFATKTALKKKINNAKYVYTEEQLKEHTSVASFEQIKATAVVW